MLYYRDYKCSNYRDYKSELLCGNMAYICLGSTHRSYECLECYYEYDCEKSKKIKFTECIYCNICIENNQKEKINNFKNICWECNKLIDKYNNVIELITQLEDFNKEYIISASKIKKELHLELKKNYKDVNFKMDIINEYK